MNREKSVRIIDYNEKRRKYRRSSSFRAEMGNKYSYIFWILVGIFTVVLWIGLYFGFVVPEENKFTYQATECTTVKSTLLPKQYNIDCPCDTTPCPGPPKSYSCIHVYVNYTFSHQEDSKKPAVTKRAKIHYSESIVNHNCSYVPNCEESQIYITNAVNNYFAMRQPSMTSFKCYYNRNNEHQVINVNYSSRRLAILLPFTVVLLVLLGTVSFRLYQRGCGCNAKRRPSRLSFLSSVDEP